MSRTLPHDTQLFLGCTDEVTAEFISSRFGDVTVGVSSEAKQLNTWRVSDYSPEYRKTQSIGKRKLLTPAQATQKHIYQEPRYPDSSDLLSDSSDNLLPDEPEMIPLDKNSIMS